jgi:hypothetical protein
MKQNIGVYICHCGTNIAATVDCQELANFARTLPHVKIARDYRYPMLLNYIKKRLAILGEYAAKGPEQQRRALVTSFGLFAFALQFQRCAKTIIGFAVV